MRYFCVFPRYAVQNEEEAQVTVGSGGSLICGDHDVDPRYLQVRDVANGACKLYVSGCKFQAPGCKLSAQKGNVA